MALYIWAGVLVPEIGRFGDDGRSERLELILHRLSPVDLVVVFGQFLFKTCQGLFLVALPGQSSSCSLHRSHACGLGLADRLWTSQGIHPSMGVPA